MISSDNTRTRVVNKLTSYSTSACEEGILTKNNIIYLIFVNSVSDNSISIDPCGK